MVKREVWKLTCPRMGPSGGPGAACPDLTIALITPPVSNFFTALAALDILDIVYVSGLPHVCPSPLPVGKGNYWGLLNSLKMKHKKINTCPEVEKWVTQKLSNP